MDMPMPPELAVAVPPIADGELEQLLDEVLALADRTPDSTVGDVVKAVLDRQASGELVLEHEDLAVDYRPWQIDGPGSAQWALAHVARAEAEAASLGEQYREWRARLDGWFEQASRRPAARREFFAGHLERYALRVRADSPRDGKGEPTVKSVVLPSGEVSTRRSGPKVVAVDEAVVVKWARDTFADDPDRLAGIVRVRESVQSAGLKAVSMVVESDGELLAVCELTGEEIPGCVVDPEQVSATVKVR